MYGQGFEKHHATQGLPIVRLQELGKDLDSEGGTPAEGWALFVWGRIQPTMRLKVRKILPPLTIQIHDKWMLSNLGPCLRFSAGRKIHRQCACSKGR